MGLVSLAFLLFVALVSELPERSAADALRGFETHSQRRRDLLDDLEEALGRGRRTAAEGRVAQLEDAMRPIFLSLPRTSEDRLPASGVRYLLHRVFVSRHGWFVQGLTAGGDSWNSSSPAAFFAEHVGTETEDLFERRLGSRGLSLHECAVFAATLESLVHEETLDRLHAAYRVAGLSAEADDATERDTEQAIDAYMVMFVLGLNHTGTEPRQVSRFWEHIERIYPAWNETHKWVREVRKEVVSSDPLSRTGFSTTTRVLEEVADRYGRWQDGECMALKDDLLKLEEGGKGRVPLSAFYASALDGNWQFKEKPEYLRQLGALDESNPSQPSVIIPNYINGASNCLASSTFYSVCCINECEALLSPIERHLAAPEAEPSRIVELVERLPSSTVEAPRSLPASLVQRLEDTASRSGGRVPIHGRQFAQWLHHVYPRECPFPHVSGMTKQMTGEEFRRETSQSTSLTLAELQDAVSELEVEEDEGASGETELQWCDVEELFVRLPSEPVRQDGWRDVFRSMAMLVAAASLCAVLLRTAAEAQGAAAGWSKKKDKFMV